MGRDKAFIEIDRQPLWQRQLRLLRSLQPHELFIAGPFRADDAITLADARPGIGPLGGIVAALRRCSAPLLLALAVDLPSMTSCYLAELLEAQSGIVPRNQPLAAVYPSTALPLAERCLTSQSYAMQDFAAHCMREGLVRRRDIAPAEEALFLNLNTPEDLFEVTHV